VPDVEPGAKPLWCTLVTFLQGKVTIPQSRRRKLRIVPFAAGGKGHSLSCVSSPHRTRSAGLRRGPRFRLTAPFTQGSLWRRNRLGARQPPWTRGLFFFFCGKAGRAAGVAKYLAGGAGVIFGRVCLPLVVRVSDNQTGKWNEMTYNRTVFVRISDSKGGAGWSV
jgi:hypothetical protein